jgi:hypothetical protein
MATKRSGRASYMKAVAAKNAKKKLQNTEGTKERADYLGSKKGLAVETLKGVLAAPYNLRMKVQNALKPKPGMGRKRRKAR